MKRMLLIIAAVAFAGSAFAQSTYVVTEKSLNLGGTKIYISPSYGLFLAKDVASARVNLTVGYNIIPELRLSLTGGYIFNDSKNFGTIALMIGSTELYTTPYSRSYSEISFGIGFIPQPNHPNSAYFPICYRWGISLTRNIAVGAEAMIGMTTVKNALFVADLGVFCALKF